MTVSLTSALTLVTFLAVAVVWEHWARLRRMRGSKIPPGPPGLPLLGNLLDVPASEEWLAYHAWSLKYKSNIIQLNVLGTSIVVLNDLESVRELMENRSSIYSGRPHLVMLRELMGLDKSMVFQDNGDFWRESRKAFHQEFKPGVISNYYPVQTKAVQELLRRLLASPDRWLDHLKHTTAAETLDTIYGISITPENDPYVEVIEVALEGIVAAMVPGTFLVEIMPLLKYVPAWVPGAGFQRKAKVWKKNYARSSLATYEGFKKGFAEDPTRISYCSQRFSLLDPDEDNTEQEMMIRENAGSVYAAAVETTHGVLSSFFLAMVMHPEAQAKAQAEIDDVLGPGRVLAYGDEDSLPYLTAIVRECLRWHEVTPIGVPHTLAVDDQYNGYFLPAGSVIIPNTWAILHDENTYPDPFSFKPERFLKDGKLDPNVMDPAEAAFGYGRRICPGRHHAIATIWLAMGSMLASFNIDKAIGPDGRPIIPSGRYTTTITSHVEPFKCAITPRSERVKEMILSSDNEAV